MYLEIFGGAFFVGSFSSTFSLLVAIKQRTVTAISLVPWCRGVDVKMDHSLRTEIRRERHIARLSKMQTEEDASSDYMLEAQIEGLEAAAPSSDDDDDWAQFNVRDIVVDEMRPRLAVSYKLLDKLLRRASSGMVFKRIEEGCQGHCTLQRLESCAGEVPSSDEAGESQASSLPAKQIEAGFFKSYAQHIKKQREMLLRKQTCGAPTKPLEPTTVRPDYTVDQHIQTLHSATRFKWDDIVDVSLLHVKDTVNVKKNARKLSAKFESEY